MNMEDEKQQKRQKNNGKGIQRVKGKVDKANWKFIRKST